MLMYAIRLERLLEMMLQDSGVRLPGLRSAEHLQKAQKQGLVMPAHLYQEIEALKRHDIT